MYSQFSSNSEADTSELPNNSLSLVKISDINK